MYTVAAIIFVLAKVANAASFLAAQGHLFASPDDVQTDPIGFVVRYTFLNPNKDDLHSKESSLLPMLASSLCLAETNLAPAVERHYRFGAKPTYVIYTDNYSDNAARRLLQANFPSLRSRVKLINLDQDPSDPARMSAFNDLGLDTVNFASVRRTLADTKYMPPGSARLLVGTDVSFLSEPHVLLATAADAAPESGLYIVDDKAFGGENYRMKGYRGPQCAGLLGDFIFLGSAVDVKESNMHDKIQWYAQQPRHTNRTEPPCLLRDLSDEQWSNGLQAIDQFAWSLALGEAVWPQGDGDAGGCRGLDTAFYQHMPQGWLRPTLEAVHDKVISDCSVAA